MKKIVALILIGSMLGCSKPPEDLMTLTCKKEEGYDGLFHAEKRTEITLIATAENQPIQLEEKTEYFNFDHEEQYRAGVDRLQVLEENQRAKKLVGSPRYQSKDETQTLEWIYTFEISKMTESDLAGLKIQIIPEKFKEHYNRETGYECNWEK